MNFFEAMAAKNMPKPEEAEVKVDLSGLDKGAALEKLDLIVQYCRKSSSQTLYVSFDAAKADGAETLFQPVARYLRDAKDEGTGLTAVPLMTPEKGGFFVRFKL